MLKNKTNIFKLINLHFAFYSIGCRAVGWVIWPKISITMQLYNGLTVPKPLEYGLSGMKVENSIDVIFFQLRLTKD